MRKEFPDAIHWLAAPPHRRRTGTRAVEVTYPDSLTTWRLTARGATADTLVGAAVARTTTTKDLIARVVTPRFLTEGDEAIDSSHRAQLPAVRPDRGGVGCPRPGVTATDVAGTNGQHRVRSPSRPGRPDAARLADRRQPSGHGRLHRLGHDRRRSRRGRDRPSRCCRSACGVRRVRPAPSPAPASRPSSLDVPATANPAARTIRVALAPSMAGSLLGALDFLTSYPYGLHRADAVVVRAQPGGHARARGVEDRADRTPAGARPPGHRRVAAAVRPTSTRTAAGVGGRPTPRRPS